MGSPSPAEILERRRGRGFSLPELGRLLAEGPPAEVQRYVKPLCLLMFSDEVLAQRARMETWSEVAVTGEFEAEEDPTLGPESTADGVRQRGLWVFPLLPGRRTFVVGRDPTCDVVLFHKQVSRRHAELSEESGVLFVRDLGSRNGTLREGETLPPHTRAPLAAGDSFVIGSSRLAPQATEVIEELARRLS